MRPIGRLAGSPCSNLQLVMVTAAMSALLLVHWLLMGTCGARFRSGTSSSDAVRLHPLYYLLSTFAVNGPGVIVITTSELEEIYRKSLVEHAKEWTRLEHKMTAIDRWDVFGATYPTCGLNRLLDTEPCHVFSLGSHGLVDFEEALLERFPHCRIHVYDHTLTEEEAAAVEAVKGCELHQVGITSNQNLADPGFQPEHKWTSISKEMETLDVPWYRLLKMDIEGFEWPVFEDYFSRNETLPFTEILVELHAHWLPKAWGADQTLRLKYFFDRMAEQQYRVANNEINLQSVNMKHDVLIPHVVEYTFLKINSRGRMILGREDL